MPNSNPLPMAGEGGLIVRLSRVRGRGRFLPLIQARLASALASLAVLPPRGETELSGQRFRNSRQNTLNIRQHIVVPEANYTKALRFQPVGPCGISRIGMLATVHFDDQPRISTQEVSNVAPYRHLSAELCACQLPIAQVLPQLALRIGRIAAQAA